MTVPFYSDEGGNIHASTKYVEMRYISSDITSEGLIPTWTRRFAAMVGMNLALACCERLTQSETKLKRLKLDKKKLLRNSGTRNSADQRKIIIRKGSWLNSMGFSDDPPPTLFKINPVIVEGSIM